MEDGSLFPEEDVQIENVDLNVKDLDKLIPDLGTMPCVLEPKFLATVKSLGVLEPILLIRQKKGKKYDIAAGRRRCKAAQSVNRKTIPARIFPYGWTKTAVLTLVENDARKSNPLSEWKAINSLISDNFALTTEDVTEKTGVSAQRIKQLLTLNDLVDPLRKAFEEGKIKPTVALLCAKERRLTQLELAKILSENGSLKVKDVTAVRRVSRSTAHQSLPASLFGGRETWHNDALSSIQSLANRLKGKIPDHIQKDLDKLADDIAKDKPGE